MVKVKQTKLNHNNNNDEHKIYNTSILTSKNKNKLIFKGGKYYRKNNSIDKNNKRTKKLLKSRTLNNTYSILLPKQSGGFIIKYLKFKYKLKKIKNIIAKLNKNEKDINQFINSYKTQTETFKRLGDKKAKTIYEDIRTQKDKTILEYLKNSISQNPAMSKEPNINTSSVEHNLDMIKSKEITIAKNLKQFDKEIKKEKPAFIKNQAKFASDSKKFRKINKEFQELQDFYTEQAEILDKFIDTEGKTQLRDSDKKNKEKYMKYKADIDYILNFKQNNIDAINNQVLALYTVLDKSDNYKQQYENLLQKNYEKVLKEWSTNYNSIYVNIQTIDGDIGRLNNTFNTIVNIIDIIKNSLSKIYISIRKTDKLNAVLKVTTILETNIKILDIIKISVNKVKFAFIQNIPIADIDLNTAYVEGALGYIENQMKQLKNSLVIDRKFLSMSDSGVISTKTLGGGASGKVIDYYTFKDYSMKTFLDTDYETIIDTLKKLNDDLKDTTAKSDIYKLNSEECLQVMKTYFSIYLFFMYYYKTRSSLPVLDPKNEELSIDDTDKKITLFFIKMIKTYETIINGAKTDIEYDDIPDYLKDSIATTIKDISDLEDFINNISTHIYSYYNIIDDNNVYNPYNTKDDKTIKHLYYLYNPYSEDSTETENLGCIKSFIGYNTSMNADFKTYEDKDKCYITAKNFLKERTSKDLLHLKYDNIPVIYDIDDNGDYKFVTVYFNQDIADIKTKIAHYDKFGDIYTKYKDLETYLSDLLVGGTTPPTQQPNINAFKTFMNDTNQHINNGNLKKMFCSDDVDDEIEEAINEMANTINFGDKLNTTISNYITNIKISIVNNWATQLVNYLSDATSTLKILIFNVIYGPVIFQKSILPYIVTQVYNNLEYNTLPPTDCNLNDTLVKILSIPNSNRTAPIIYKNFYILLYSFDDKSKIDTFKLKIDFLKYLLIWLNSKCNSDANKKLQTDKISEIIKHFYSASSSFKLNSIQIEIDKLKDNDIIKQFKPQEQKIFMTEYKALFASYKTLENNTPTLVKEDKDLYNSTNPIVERLELQYYYDDKIAYDGDTAYNNSNKPDFIAKAITTPLEKEKLYPTLDTTNIKRFVSFNVHRWNMIGDTSDLRTEPEHAIHFISKTLPDTNMIGFLEYSLYPDTPEKAGVHISAYAGGSIQHKNNNNYNNYNNTPLQYGGVGGKAIPVSSKSITDTLRNEMKNLDKYVIMNDNFNSKTTDKSFIGKAIYSDGALSDTKKIDIVGSNDSLLYTSYKINKKSIGLYLVNLTDETRSSSPLSFRDKIKNIIQAIKTNIKSSYNKNVVVMGNFYISPKDDPDTFKQFIDANYIAIGDPSSFTYIDKTTIDLCYVSEDFKKNFTILNEKDIVVKSGGVSDHYPIYIDIKENDDDIVAKAADDTITTISPDGSITLKSKDGITITIKKDITSGAKPDDLIVTKIAADGKTSIPTTLQATKEKDGSIILKEANGSGTVISINPNDATITVIDNTSGSVSGSSGTETDDAKDLAEAEKEKASQLFSTFLVDTKDMTDIISHNKDIILDKIIQIINIINNSLKQEDYNKITHKLSILSQNIIQLKVIEPKLTPNQVIIHEYNKKSKDFSWIDDFATKETSKLNLIDETKELSKLIKAEPDIAKILPSHIDNISNEEILIIIGAMTPKGRQINKETIQKYLDKLKNDDNAKKIVKYIEDTFVSRLFEKCSYLSLLTENTLSKVISEANTRNECNKQLATLTKEYSDKKKDRR